MKNGIQAFLTVAGLMAVLSVCVLFFFYFMGTQYYPRFFPAIPVFYILISVPLCLVLGNFLKGDATTPPSLKQLMFIRLLKVAGSICIFVIGLILDKTTVIPFAIVFVVFYVVYSIYETKLMLLFQKNR